MSIVTKKFSSGDVIIKEGEIGKSFFKLLAGRGYVFSDYDKKDQFQLATLETGEYFGEMAIIDEYPRNATIVARGSVELIEIPANELDTYFAENPSEIIELMKVLGRRVQTMTKDYYDAQNLLKELRESDKSKNKSLFSKIKRHMNVYQANKDKLEAPVTDALRDTLENTADEGFGKIESYQPGDIIYNEGDKENCMFILHIGTVGLYNNYGSAGEVKVSELGDNSFFGEMGMLADEPREATAVAEAPDTYVEVICQEDLEPIYLSCPVKINMLLRHLSYRLRKLNIDFIYTCKEITETYGEK